MGDRYILTVKCTDCNTIDDDVYYAPTCGFMDWECPECGKKIDLEEYSGIDALGCANTKYGENYINEQKEEKDGN